MGAARMKKGWPVKSIGELCILRPPKAEARSRLKDESYVSFLPMEDMGIDLKYPIPSKERMLREVDGSYTYFADGDVLLAKITPCFQNGKLGIAKDLRNGTGFGSSEFFVLRPNPVLNSEYLYYFLSRSIFREEGVLCMGGSVGHQRVPPDFLLSQQIILPSLPEQQRIVGVLDEAFACLATAQANAEKNLQNARALFESHLQSVFTQRGKGWKMVKLDDLTGLARGHNPPKSKFSYEAKPGYVRFYQIRDGSSDNHTVYVPDTPQLHKMKKDDIMMVAYRHVGRVFRGVEGAFNVALCKISNARRDLLDDEYLFHILPSHFVKGELLKRSERSLIPSMSIEHLREIQIPLPSLKEQQRIVKTMTLLSIGTQRLEGIYQQKQMALSALKKSLLHQAFAGQL